MTKALAIIKETPSGASKGAPDITLPYSGFVYVGNLPGQYAAYLIVGTPAQLTAINADPNTVAGVAITDDGVVKWPEMEQPVPPAMRTRINAYRQAQGLSTIGAGVTLRQVAQFAAAHFDGRGNFDVFDGN